MVKVYVKTLCREVPIDDINSVGQTAFLQDIASNSEEFKGANIERLRFIYNGRILNDEKMKNITNDDAIRVVCIPESPDEKPITDQQRQAVADITETWENLWRNREDRRLHGYSHDFALPEHASYFIKKFPTLVFDSRLLSVISDWYIFLFYCIRDEFEEDAPRNEFKFKNPLYHEVLTKIMTAIGSRYGFKFDANQKPQQQQQQQLLPQPAISQAFLQNALQAALAGFNNQARAAAGGAAPAPVPVAPVAQAPPPQQQPRDDPMEGIPNQAENVALLRSFGFENEELIVLALEQSNGDIQEAMEFLVEMNQS